MNELTIRPIEDNDLEWMRKWLPKEHVAPWYTHPDDWLYEIKERKGEFSFIHHFITILDSKPIGFCQYYPCTEAKEDWYGDIDPDGTYSIDYMVGEEEFLRKGYGKASIRLLLQMIFSLQEAKRIIVQPELANHASCHSLLACGFSYDEKNKLFFRQKGVDTHG